MRESGIEKTSNRGNRPQDMATMVAEGRSEDVSSYLSSTAECVERVVGAVGVGSV